MKTSCSPRRKPSLASSVTRIIISVVSVGALTGGFGMLVPHVYGLNECGDFFTGRLVLAGCLLMIATGGAMVVARRSGLAFGVVVALSCVFNLAARQDPVGAMMNWHVQNVDFTRIEQGARTQDCYSIEAREVIVHDNGTYIAMGQGRPAAD